MAQLAFNDTAFMCELDKETWAAFNDHEYNIDTTCLSTNEVLIRAHAL